MTTAAHRFVRRAALVLAPLLASCASVPPPPKPPITGQRPLAALLEVAAYPNSDTVVVRTTTVSELG